MQEKSKISNLRVSNNMFSNFLEEKKLILPTDNLIETTDSITDSISIFMPRNYSMNIILHNMNPLEHGIVFAPLQKAQYNFICNGNFPCTSTYARKMLEQDAFNIGICSTDPKTYKKGKTFYQKFGKGMIAIGVPIEIYEEDIKDKELGEGKIYLLSYRAQK